jgi:hypothetical protein
MKGKEV